MSRPVDSLHLVHTEDECLAGAHVLAEAEPVVAGGGRSTDGGEVPAFDGFDVTVETEAVGDPRIHGSGLVEVAMAAAGQAEASDRDATVERRPRLTVVEDDGLLGLADL